MNLFKRLLGRTRPEAPPASVTVAPDILQPAPINTEEDLDQVLRRLEQQLRSRPQTSLPIVSLRVREMLGKPRICWHFATGYGVGLDVEAAERFLTQALAPYGMKVSGGDYMGDRNGNRHQFWDFVIKAPRGEMYEAQIQALDRLGREPALKKAANLVTEGQFDLLVAWLREGKYYGIPAEALANCSRPEAAHAIVPLLKDPRSETRTRAAAALGPLGGSDAARALCEVLPGAKPKEEFWRIAGALDRLAWAGSVGPLTAAIAESQDSSVRAALARALVRCGDVENGLSTLYAGLSDDRGSNDYASAIAALDQGGILDSRLIPEMAALMERTENNNTKQIITQLIARHKDEWDQIRKPNKATPIRNLPTKNVAPFSGEVMFPIDEASAITGIPVDQINKLIRERRVFSAQVLGSLRVSLNGSAPCGEIVDNPDPRYRMIGARQDTAAATVSSTPGECGCLTEHAAFALATFDGPHRPCTIVASHCSDCQTMYQTVIIDGHVTRETLIERSTRLSCPRSRAEQEFTGMIARAKQIGYTGGRLDPIMLPDLGKRSKSALKAPPAAESCSAGSPPSDRSEPLFESGEPDKGKVTFLRKRTQTGRLGTVTTYEEYTGSTAEAARRFLLTKQVKEPAYYVVVETPEGVWGLDVEGLYLEHLAPWQSDVRVAQINGATGSGLPSLFGLRQAAQGMIDNFIHTVVCGKCGGEWQDGLRYRAITVVQCPHCGTKNSVDSSRFTCVSH